ncbi:MAG: ribonuclease Z [bacterium]|nr:ribonuclease Z [bacterium]
MPLNKLVLLGTSSGAPQPDRATSGYLLQAGDSLSLLDCGSGISSSYLRRGLNPVDLDRIFITHTHPDHVCELPLVLQMLYLAGRQDPLEIYVPQEFAEPLRNYLPSLYLFPEKLPFDLNIKGYGGGELFSRDFKLVAYPNDHLAGNQEVIERFGYQNRMQSFSFDIEIGNSRLFYSGDIQSFEDIRDHLVGTDIALVESTHFDLDELLVLIPRITVGKIILTHLGDKRQIEEIHERIRRSGLKNIVTAFEGMEITLE